MARTFEPGTRMWMSRSWPMLPLMLPLTPVNGGEPARESYARIGGDTGRNAAVSEIGCRPVSAPAPFSRAYQRMSLLSVISEPAWKTCVSVSSSRSREFGVSRSCVPTSARPSIPTALLVSCWPDEAGVPVAVEGEELRAGELRGGGAGVVGVVGTADLDRVVVGGAGRARDRGSAGRRHGRGDGAAAQEPPALEPSAVDVVWCCSLADLRHRFLPLLLSRTF